MKTDGYIFKENLSSLYVFFGIILSFFVGLWISNEAFPFGDKFAILLFIVIIIYLILLVIHIWRKIKHPKLLIIDENGGIHHYNRRFTLSSNSTFWVDDYMFYSWNKINGFYFDWMMSRGVVPYRFLWTRNGGAFVLRLCFLWERFYGKKHNYIDAIEECSGGRCVLNRAKYDENRKIRNRSLWKYYIFPLLIGIALAMLLNKFGVR